LSLLSITLSVTIFRLAQILPLFPYTTLFRSSRKPLFVPIRGPLTRPPTTLRPIGQLVAEPKKLLDPIPRNLHNSPGRSDQLYEIHSRDLSSTRRGRN